jgi:uncharacterized protein
MKRICKRFQLIFIILCSTAQAEIIVPAFKNNVSDLSGSLSISQLQTLNDRESTFEKIKLAKVAILILPTTGTEDIEQFGERVSDTWGIGRVGAESCCGQDTLRRNNSVLLVVAMQDKAVLITRGVGLRNVLEEKDVNRIVTEVMQPYFLQKEFYLGIDAGLNAVFKEIDRAGIAAPEVIPEESYLEKHSFIIGLSVLVIGILTLSRYFEPGRASLIISSLIGGLIWVTTHLFERVVQLTPFIFLISFLSIAFIKRHFRSNSATNENGDGSWSDYGGSDSGSGGGDSGGSKESTSGAGGEFSGGGASSDWSDSGGSSDSSGGDGGGGGD